MANEQRSNLAPVRWKVPVLIVGGGVVGLSASMILSQLGVEHLLVSYHPNTSPRPRAHILNQRTMEIFTQVGVAADIYKVSTPPEQMKYAAWYSGLAGPDERYGRELGRVEAWGCGLDDPDYLQSSACAPANYPQMYVEPILKHKAEALAPGRVLFNHEYLELEQTEQYVLASIRDRSSGEIFQVQAQYVIGADGGKRIGGQVGIALEAQGQSMRMSSVHFAADLSAHAQAHDVMTRFMINPDFGGSWASGVLIPEGPTRWGHESEEWVFHSKYGLDPDGPLDTKKVVERLHQVLGIPDLQAKVIHVTEWQMGCFLAQRYRHQRVLLVGDACHQHPPTGGLGMNAGIQDAYNLAWKLAAVLNNDAGESLLDSYEVERRPVAQANMNLAMQNAMNHFEIDRALGLSDELGIEENWRRLAQLWDDTPATEAVRIAASQAIALQRVGFRHHKAEVGAIYGQGALIDDHSPEPVPVHPVLVYEPSTRPGHPLPHVWLSRLGQRKDLRAFVEEGQFLLIAGEQGLEWIQAAQRWSAQHAVTIRAIRVGLFEGDWLDMRGSWQRLRQIGASGMVLVRPDRYVGGRIQQLDGNADEQLQDMMHTLLCSQPVGKQPHSIHNTAMAAVS